MWNKMFGWKKRSGDFCPIGLLWRLFLIFYYFRARNKARFLNVLYITVRIRRNNMKYCFCKISCYTKTKLEKKMLCLTVKGHYKFTKIQKYKCLYEVKFPPQVFYETPSRVTCVVSGNHCLRGMLLSGAQT